jgi:hypothetical protein
MTDDLELLQEDANRLHRDLQRGQLRDIPSVIREMEGLMSDETDILKNKIIKEIEKLESARDELDYALEVEGDEVDKAKTVEEEWESLMDKIKSHDKDYVVTPHVEKVLKILKDIDNRLDNILELKDEEKSELAGSGKNLKKFIYQDLKEASQTHQKIAVFRQVLVEVSKETFAEEGRFGTDYKLAKELGPSEIEEIQESWVQYEKHVGQLDQNWLPNILEKEEEFLDLLEEVSHEVENLIELDHEVLAQIEEDSSKGSRFLGRNKGELVEYLEMEEYTSDGTAVSEVEDMEPTTDKAERVLEDISGKVEKLKSESHSEEGGLQNMLSDLRNYVSDHKRDIRQEMDRIENLDTNDDPLDLPEKYPAPVQNKAQQIVDNIQKIKAAKNREYWDTPIESEIEDLQRRVENLHRIHDREVEDIRDFESRAEEIRLVLEGDPSKGDSITGILTGFRSLMRDKEGIDTILDLPTEQQVNNNFRNVDLEDLPDHLSDKVRSYRSGSSTGELNPNDFLTQHDILVGGKNFDHGLYYLLQNPGRDDPSQKGGLVGKLEEDFENIYGEEGESENLFETVRKELEDIRSKKQELEDALDEYDSIKQDLEEGTALNMGEFGERMNVSGAVQEAAAEKIYRDLDESTDTKAQTLRREIRQELRPWVEEELENQISEIEEILFDEEGSILDESQFEEEEMEKAVKSITRALDDLIDEVGNSSSAIGMDSDVEFVVDKIIESLRNIAEKATSLEKEHDNDLKSFVEWAQEEG